MDIEILPNWRAVGKRLLAIMIGLALGHFIYQGIKHDFFESHECAPSPEGSLKGH